MADTLSTITNFINSPPGELVAGGVLAGIVWKCFEKVEGVLKENTKLKIAVWLVGVKPFGPQMEPWPDTFASIFNRVFGKQYLTARCFLLSTSLSFAFGIVLTVLTPSPYNGLPLAVRIGEALGQMGSTLLCGKVISDYLSLGSTKLTLYFMRRTQSVALWLGLVLADALLTAYLAIVGLTFGLFAGSFVLRWVERRYYVLPLAWQDVVNIAVGVPQHPVRFIQAAATMPYVAPLFLSGFVTSIWLWLYAGSGFLLKFARRFDIGFAWFNSHFDIEHKPLSAIGLVAGSIVAVLWWMVVVVRWVG